MEKCIKALLVFYSKDVPKIHDIGELVHYLPDKAVVPLDIVEQETLSDYAVASRYPGDWEPYSREDAIKAFNMAEKLRGAVSKLLEP